MKSKVHVKIPTEVLGRGAVLSFIIVVPFLRVKLFDTGPILECRVCDTMIRHDSTRTAAADWKTPFNAFLQLQIGCQINIVK